MDMRSSEPFSEAFDFASGAIGDRFQNPLWFLTELFLGRRFRLAVAEVKTFGSIVVSTALRKRAATDSSERDPGVQDQDGEEQQIKGSLINSLIDEIKDPVVVADAALNYLSAGRDTTAQALSWTFYLLMRHAHVIAEIRKELDSVAADEQGHSKLTFDNIQPTSMPYTLAAFYEALRLYPPVPFEIKQCITATTLPDGTNLPAAAVVVWCPWAMNRSTRIWGPDAHTYRPERWLENNVASNTSSQDSKPIFRPRSQHEFPVFNGGPRTCLGKKMAELQAVYIIATLVDQFDFCEVIAAGGCPVERRSRNSLTLPMEGGLPCFISVPSRRMAFSPP
jgi:cytochrome P450